MNPKEIAKTAVKALFVNKTRTFLTTLGVIIGVFSVVSLVSLVQGVENYITEQFANVGSNLFFISPGSGMGFTDDPSITYSTNKLKPSQADLIEKNAGDYLIGATPIIRLETPVKYKTNSYLATVTGTNEKVFAIADLELEAGRYFSKADVRSRSRVGVIHPEVAKELFGSKTSGLGKTVKINNESIEIIGVIKEKNREFDGRIGLPITTMEDILDIDDVAFIGMKAKESVDVDTAIREVELAMLKELKKEDFSILSQKDVLSSVQDILGMLGMILGAIAGISLIVGGIGIMNIMLVSVTERTREIGLRKALGATSRDIRLQFLIESALISLSGGVAGLIAGWGVAIFARQWIQAEVPLWSAALGLGFSILVGIVFGTYPASQAAKKSPIEALRYE